MGDDRAATVGDLRSLERKVDDLRDVMNRFLVLEEKQAGHAHRLGAAESSLAQANSGLAEAKHSLALQGQRIGLLETSIAAAVPKIDSTTVKLDKWINRGMGVWGATMALWALSNSPTVLSFLSR